MSSSSDNIFGLGTTQIAIPAGATLAKWIDCGEKVTSIQIKYFSGGTLEIVGSPLGGTMPGASLAGLPGTQYIMGTSEVQSIDGPCRFYLMASGSTAVACLMYGLTSPGYQGRS